MADKTINFGLTKPLPEEFYDVAVQNGNMDIIDAELKKKFDPENLPTPAMIGALDADSIEQYDKVFCAIYGETSLDDISAAVKAEKFVYCDFAGMYAPLMGGIGGLFFSFCCGNDKDGYTFSIDTNGWSYTTYGGYTPKAHANSHKTGGADALTPADIGAAPDGFGLGGNIQRLTTQAEMDAFTVSGWKSFYNVSTPLVAGGTKIYTGVVRCDAYSENYCVQSICSVGSGYFLQRICSYGEWGEWEWENPPMVLGVEYRTTERWNDKPVYCKLVDLGVSTSAKVITVLTSGNRMIRHVDRCSSYPLPHINGTMDSAYTYYLMPDQSGFALKMFCGANVTGLQTYSVIYYYKE